MKQIVPFKKELPFKTKVSEITSISLEREIEVVNEGIVTGVFHITGDYKMNEGSINRESFSFDLPFDITLDPRYDVNTVKADIDDFSYDVINDDILKVDIDLFIEAEYLPIEEDDIKEEDSSRSEKEEVKEEVIEVACEKEEKASEEMSDMINEKDVKEEVKVDNREEGVTASDLFSNLDETETYTTYYVYIVKEEDTVDKILSKYGISKEEFEDYNDITSIKPGDKVIIPKSSE